MTMHRAFGSTGIFFRSVAVPGVGRMSVGYKHSRDLLILSFPKLAKRFGNESATRFKPIPSE